MSQRTFRILLAVGLVLVAICVAGWALNAHVSVQTGCRTVEGEKLCGENLKAYEDFEKTVRSAFPDE